MVIFNLYCIPVAILLTLALLLMNSAVGFEDPQMELLAAGIVTTFVTAVCEYIGLAARLFFLPIWMIGLGVTAYQTYQLWGWFVIVPIGVAVMSLFIVGTIMERRERDVWAQAPSQLEEARRCLEAGDRPEMWEALELAFFVPEFLDLDAEIYAHNREVVEFLLTVLSDEEQYSQDVLNRLALVKDAIDEAHDAETPRDEISGSLQFVKDLLANRGQGDVTEEGA